MAKAQAVDIKPAKAKPDVTDKDPRDKDLQVLHINVTKAEHKAFKAEAGNADRSMLEHFRAMWKFYNESHL